MYKNLLILVYKKIVIFSDSKHSNVNSQYQYIFLVKIKRKKKNTVRALLVEVPFEDFHLNCKILPKLFRTSPISTMNVRWGWRFEKNMAALKRVPLI